MILDRINATNDIKKIKEEDYQALAQEIREFLISKISRSGGHLASNLGVVELTMALHIALNLPKDKIVWDVGHQAYTHKLLTGRKEEFGGLRTYGGMSGFPKRRESNSDCFDTGHSSTSISAALGIVNGNMLNGDDSTVVAVIGDGAFTGGMAFEALNNASSLKRNFIIILNDNHMSISENVGGFSNYLSNLRAGEFYNGMKVEVAKSLNKIPVLGEKMVRQIKKTKSGIKQLVVQKQGMLFEDMGITYLGPVDGHDIKKMVRILRDAKRLNHPVVIHVLTKKGKGYLPAEKNPSRFHGVEPFDRNTARPLTPKVNPTYTDCFGRAICKAAKKNEKIVAITAAMPDGTGLKRFSREYPNRFFDVGIAEEHGVTFAAGLAASGQKPVFAVYSSFLQRAYDQILHDVCIQNLPVIFAVDRAGLVGGDGETHQGIFDISYLSSIPNMNIFAPKNGQELEDVIEFAAQFSGPLAIRYPRGEAYQGLAEFRAPICYGKAEMIYKEKDIVLLAVGNMVKLAQQVRECLKEEGYYVTLVNVRFIRPFDQSLLDELTESHEYFITMEENVINGSFGEMVLRYMNNMGYHKKIYNVAVPNIYVEHGSVDILQREVGLDVDSILDKIHGLMEMD